LFKKEDCRTPNQKNTLTLARYQASAALCLRPLLYSSWHPRRAKTTFSVI